MKKFFLILPIVFLLLNISPVNGEEVVQNSSDTNSTIQESQKFLDNLLSVLKDPKQLQILIATLEEVKNKASENSKVLEKAKESNSLQSLDVIVHNYFYKVYEKIRDLKVNNLIFNLIRNIISETQNLEYKSLIILALITSIMSIFLVLVDKIWFKFIYSVEDYIEEDFQKYQRKKYLLKTYIFLLFINLKLFFPVFLTIFIAIGLSKIFFEPAFHDSVTNLLVVFLIVKTLWRVIDIIFYNVKRKTIIKLKKWLRFVLLALFLFLFLNYSLYLDNSIYLIKVNIFFCVLISLFAFWKLRVLIKVIISRAYHNDNQYKSYKTFLLHVKKFYISLFYIAIFLYATTIVFLNSSMTKSIIIRFLFLGIGILVIYFLKSYIYYLVKNIVVNKIEKSKISLYNVSLRSLYEAKSINFNFFWKFSKVLYFILFTFIYIYFIDNILNTNILDAILYLSNLRIPDIIIDSIISFIFLVIFTFFLVLLIQNYIMSEAKKENHLYVRKILTLYAICQRPYKIIFSIIMIIIILSYIGISIKTLLASTGILTLLIAFGMKDIIQNFFNSIMFLLEDSFSLNDFIEIEGIRGVVEEISMLYVKLRDPEGKLNMVPFKNISTIINYTKDYSYALVDVGIAYQSDIEKVKVLLDEVYEELKNDKEIASFIQGPLELIGITNFVEDGVNIRCKIMTIAGKQFVTRAALLEKIYDKFVSRGIEIPSPGRLFASKIIKKQL